MFNMKKNKICYFVPRNREFIKKPIKEKKEMLKELETLPDAVLESNLTFSAKIFYQMARSVSREIHYHKMFTRLKIERDSILTGIIQPEHSIEDLILKFFYERFPKFTIILYSMKRNKTYFIAPIEVINDLKNVNNIKIKVESDFILGKSQLKSKDLISLFSPLLKKHDLFDELLDSDVDIKKLFKTFYDSQYIDSRENYRLFTQNLPKKYQKKKDMVVEKTFHTKTLDKFVKN